MKNLLLTIISIIFLSACSILQLVSSNHPRKVSTYVNSIFDIPSACILPCVMGMQIGNAPDLEIMSRLNRIEEFGGVREISNDVASYAIATEPRGDFMTSLYFRDDLIQSIGLSLSYPEEWLLPNPFTFDNVLKQLNHPDEIYILFSGPPAGYTLLLVYETEQMVLEYRFVVAVPERFDDEPIPFCPVESPITSLQRLSVSIISSDEGDWLLDIVPDLFEVRVSRPLLPISELTEFDQSSLLESVKSGCVDLTTFEALRDKGYQY